MKLLILTQKVDKNDDVLGFMHGWISEFSKHCEKLTVIALGVGEYDLPKNVKVFSLGKEKTADLRRMDADQMQKTDEASPRPSLRGVERSETTWQSKPKYLFNFYKYIWQERKNYDNVFVHMNPEYVVLGGVFWRLWHKKIGLWYMHKAVNLKLVLAEKLTNHIFSATPESFRLKTKKLHITGHGIDLTQFQEKERRSVLQNSVFKIITVGRISPIKNQNVLIEALGLLKKDYPNFKFQLEIVGEANSYKDREYKNLIKKLIKANSLESEIVFRSSVPNNEIVKIYKNSDLSVNLSPTGGADKVVLESMACELPVLAFNKTFEKILPSDLILDELKPELLSQKIYSLSQNQNLNFGLRQIVKNEHSLEKLIPNILDKYNF